MPRGFVGGHIKSVELNRREVAQVVRKSQMGIVSRAVLIAERQAKINVNNAPRGEIRKGTKPKRGSIPQSQLDWAKSQPMAVSVGKLGKRTGSGQSSITHDIREDGTKVIGSVGTNMPHMLWGEFGTRSAPARPWLRPAVNDMRKRLKLETIT